jgi:hypothetical protein
MLAKVERYKCFYCERLMQKGEIYHLMLREKWLKSRIKSENKHANGERTRRVWTFRKPAERTMTVCDECYRDHCGIGDRCLHGSWEVINVQ